jgi:hypothetical protein
LAILKFDLTQIHQLAPDSSSITAANKLAIASKWPKLAFNDQAVWGYCQGSGKNPYKTAIDTQNLAFKCSCPSRKFPCKHGLGLLMIYSQNPNSFSNKNELPDFVNEWLNKREARQEKAAQKTDKPVDEKVQNKRIEKRENKVDGGIDELQLWLKDVVRNGIMNVPQNIYSFIINIASRMVDAQAGGLAAELRSIENINFYAEGWEKQLLKKLSRIYTITELYKQRTQLNSDWQAEINGLVGWPVNKEEVLAQSPAKDQWVVFSHRTETNDKLTTIRNWLYGINHQKIALVLDFYAGSQVPSDLLSAGQHIDAELSFYPGVGNQRALIKSKSSANAPLTLKPKLNSLDELFDHFSEIKSINPLIEHTAALIANVNIAFQNEKMQLVDAYSNSILIENTQEQLWQLLAVSGGKSFDAFILKESHHFSVAAIVINQHIHCL